MRARLLITYPAGQKPDPSKTPFAPPIFLAGEVVGVFTTTWVRRLENLTLDDLTEQNVREALALSEDTDVYLTAPREAPDDDLFSPAFQQWRRAWWQESVALLGQQKPLAKVS